MLKSTLDATTKAMEASRMKQPKLNNFKITKGHVVSAAVVSALLSAATFWVNSVPNQTEGERIGIEEEAKLVVEGFRSVNNPTHGQPLIPGDYNSAVINLNDGSTCRVRFEHETTKHGGMPWGADVTDWGDCPLKDD